MPLLPLDRLPLPSLRTYTIISVLLLIFSIIYIYQSVLKDENDGFDTPLAVFHLLRISNDSTYSENAFRDRIFLFAYSLFKEPFCLIVIINMAYCCLILFGKLLQKLVFNQLRVIEQQHLKDKFWNFVFYKFIFIFGVMNAQEMEEIVLWSAWFSVLGFLHIMTLLCRDRFEYFASSPTVSVPSHVKLIVLLLWIQLIAFFLFALSLCAWIQYVSVNTFAFMAAECLLLILKTLFVLIKSGIHLWDILGNELWESRMIYSYYVEFIFEVSALFVDFMHHVHMLCWGNIFLSMASLIICMQLRYLFYELQRRLKRHKNYRNVVNSMQAQLPMALVEELQGSDECAICWEKMESARKLPCNHLFHNACLRSWLEQDTSCPICRLSLNEIASSHRQINPQQIGEGHMHAPLVQPITENIINDNTTTRMTNHFHFDGSRYVSWLPSFSVEVTHMHLLGQQRQQNVHTSLYDNMARQVQEVFPDFPTSTILEDLRMTRSVESTIENIIEGRILPLAINNTFTSESSIDSRTSAPVIEQQTLDNPPIPTIDKIPGNLDSQQDGETREQIVGCGGRFSKCPAEREMMLSLRKRELIDKAKKRYLSKNNSEINEDGHGYNFLERGESTVDRTRQRRLN